MKVWLRDSRNPSQFTKVDETGIKVRPPHSRRDQLSPQFCAAYGGREIAALPPRCAGLHRTMRSYRGRNRPPQGHDSDDGHGARRGIGHAPVFFQPIPARRIWHLPGARRPASHDQPPPSPRRIRIRQGPLRRHRPNKLKAILVDLERSDTSPASSTSSRRRCRSCRPRPTRPGRRRPTLRPPEADRCARRLHLATYKPRTKRLQVSAVRQAGHLLQRKSLHNHSFQRLRHPGSARPFLGTREDAACPATWRC